MGLEYVTLLSGSVASLSRSFLLHSGRGSGYGARAPLPCPASGPLRDSHSYSGALEDLFGGGRGMKEKRSVGELLLFLCDYFYADNLGFLDSL